MPESSKRATESLPPCTDPVPASYPYCIARPMEVSRRGINCVGGERRRLLYYEANVGDQLIYTPPSPPHHHSHPTPSPLSVSTTYQGIWLRAAGYWLPPSVRAMRDHRLSLPHRVGSVGEGQLISLLFRTLTCQISEISRQARTLIVYTHTRSLRLSANT
jgi:hypothetical protein